MAFYMGLSNRYGLKYQSCNMDESNWYESIHSSYSTQNSVRNSNNIDTSMTVPVSPVFTSHTVSDSETEYSHSSASSQRDANASTTDSLYSEHMLTPVPIKTSAKGHAPICTPSRSSTLIPRTVQIHRPLYSSQQGHITEPINTADQIQCSTQGETPSPVHTNNEECFSNNNQVSNFFSKNKPIATEKKGSITDTHTVFSSNKTHISSNHDSSIDGIGYEMEESIANVSKDCSLYTPLNYSVAKPLDCSVAKKKEGQKKSKKQRYLDETPEQREERLERIRNLALFRRSNETPEQRAHRLMVGRERMKVLRDNETEEDKTKRLQKGKMLQHQRRIREKLTETKEERKARLREARGRSRQRRTEETSEQKAERLRVTRDRLRFKRQNESPETRAGRLKTVRERKKIKYHQMSHEDKIMMRIREQEKKVMKINKSNSDYKRKTRGSDVKYDTFEDDLEDALLQLHDGQFQYLNIPRTPPVLLNQRKTNPIDFFVKKEIEDPPPDYHQEDIDIHQDVKPVVKDIDKDLSGAADHGNTQSFLSDSECEDS